MRGIVGGPAPAEHGEYNFILVSYKKQTNKKKE